MSSIPTNPVLPTPKRGRLRMRLVETSRLYIALYALMLPTIVSMVVFSYYPKADVVIKAFFRWEPGATEEYIGIKNFLDAAADPLFWHCFQLVAILLVANLVKMWPSIITAIALHRLASDRWRYIFQVCFVIPMVIPGLVWLLIWKSFYEPDFGLLNRFLNTTGLMSALHALDGTVGAPGLMPRLAASLQPTLHLVEQVFSSVWGLLLFAVMLMTLPGGEQRAKRWRGHVALLGAAFCTALALLAGRHGSTGGFWAGVVGVIALLSVARTAIGTRWVIWTFWLLVGIWACWSRLLTLPALLAAAIAVGELARLKLDGLTVEDWLGRAGWALLTVGSLLVLLGMIWLAPTGQFEFGSPAWLGNKDLVIPAIIFWGFPWVGTVGVLIYLSGLQQISTDVYEAAELDGVGPVARLFQIELPLIMTQVRINLIFMTIGTLTAYEFFLILLGVNGGPGNKGMVPGLYMYQQAFTHGKFGYACALGLVLFVMILLLTVVYQRYVKVEK